MQRNQFDEIEILKSDLEKDFNENLNEPLESRILSLIETFTLHLKMYLRSILDNEFVSEELSDQIYLPQNLIYIIVFGIDSINLETIPNLIDLDSSKRHSFIQGMRALFYLSTIRADHFRMECYATQLNCSHLHNAQVALYSLLNHVHHNPLEKDLQDLFHLFFDKVRACYPAIIRTKDIQDFTNEDAAPTLFGSNWYDIFLYSESSNIINKYQQLQI